jgi:hemerythrin-like domain-containing protein
MDDGRRALLKVASAGFLQIAGAGIVLAGCREDQRVKAEPPKEDQGEDVSATEDLMREHGVIRRILVVYREAAARLRTAPVSVLPDALQKAAMLMRSFGEDYHEKQLEEANIFPALTKTASPLTGTVDTLIAQHQRGREITEYILAVTRATIGAAAAEPLARTLDAFTRMYEEHAAIEDTIVFPAWKKVLTPKQLDEMGDHFEDIEHKTFGKDGFEDAVHEVGAIEKILGIDLAALTAPPPPKP